MGPYYPQTTNAVEGGWHAVYLFTDRPFSRVDWYVNDQLEFTERASYDTQTDSYFSHQYENGSTTGAPATVTAVAYRRFHDPRIWTGDSKEMTLHVYSGHGFYWRKTVARIHEIENTGGDTYRLRTVHIIEYYNDGDGQDSLPMRRKAAWLREDGGGLLEWPNDEGPFPIERRFRGSLEKQLTLDITLVANGSYAVRAYTNIFADETASRRSPKAEDVYVIYDPDADDPLPIETGVEGENVNKVPEEID